VTTHGSEIRMNILTLLGQKYTKYRYKRDKLNIIQQIPTQQLQQIIKKYRLDGWEVAPEYHANEVCVDSWQYKLRKGTSVLQCQWSKEMEGQISGPQRIIVGLGEEFCLTVNSAPNFH
jgi:hypothetical protein